MPSITSTDPDIQRFAVWYEVFGIDSDYNYDPVWAKCEELGIAFVPFYPLHGPGSNAEKLTWLLERAPNVLPIPGTRSVEHLRENLAVLDRLG